jgi:hypothetical protein
MRFEAQPDAVARAEMGASMPPGYVRGKPRTFQQWAVAHAEAFR